MAVANRGCGPAVGGPCTVQLLNSTRVSTRDVAVHASCNMAVYEMGGGGGHSHTRLAVTRPTAHLTHDSPPSRDDQHATAQRFRDGSTRLLASNFDGLHSEGTRLGPTLRDSVIEHVGDDFFNVQNAIDVVLGWESVPLGQPTSRDQLGWESVPLRQPTGRGRAITRAPRLVVADASFGSTFPLAHGTAFRFFLPQPRDVWHSRPIWNATVCNTARLQGAAAEPWVHRAANISAEFAARYGWSLASFQSEQFELWALSFCEPDPDPPPTVAYTAFAQVNSSVGAHLVRNRFSDGLGRVGPLLSPHSVVEGNVFKGTMLGGLLLSAEITWLSGNLGLHDVRITGNTFVDCCSYLELGYTGGQCNATGYPVWAPAGPVPGLYLDNNTVHERARIAPPASRRLRAWSFWRRQHPQGRRETSSPLPPPPSPVAAAADSSPQLDEFGCPMRRGSHSCDV